MINDFEIRGDITAIFLDTKNYGRIETLISTNKLEMVKEFPYAWRAKWSEDVENFYCVGYINLDNNKKKIIRLHRLIMNCPEDKIIDHFNHNTLDNTDSNLRIVSNAENQQNRLVQKNNSSGVRGVYWHKHSQKWLARIQVYKERKIIGYYDSIEEAEFAIKEARAKYMPYSQEAFLKQERLFV
ncbi:HNH endonuclease [Heyndrickxia sp. FSL W8-0496]|uniref:HNH endonuclease n=1 Tax=Heyndrickxia sp. FSL W8-0496 TaxID=2954702 RepID=UPI0030F59E95